MSKVETVVVKGNVGIVGMTQACSGNAGANQKAHKSAGQAWGQTVLWVNEKQDLGSFDSTKEQKEIAEDVRKAYKSAFLSDWQDAADDGEKEELTDETIGKNYRTGKMVSVLKDGEPIWSSWCETKLSIQYCGDLATIIKGEKVPDLLVDVKRKKVMAKNAALKLAKVPETPLKTIVRSAEMIETKATEVAAKDLTEAINEVAKALKSLQDIKDAKVVPIPVEPEVAEAV